VKYDHERAQRVADRLSQVINEAKDAFAVEKVLAVASLLRAMGEAMYDREELDHDSVLKDYQKSPSWPAALILVGDLPLELYNLFLRERENPELNASIWKQFEEKLNGEDN